jgi:hypothetical protein
MKADVMTPEMRAEAEQHLKAVITPTNTPKAGAKTPTPKVSATATLKPGETPSRTPTRTPMPVVTP